MEKDTQKRSSEGGIAHLSDHAKGVGGRHTPSPSPPWGGRYLHECTNLNFSPTTACAIKIDPRLEELKQMGLQAVWIAVAEKIGIDNMLNAWQILDQDKTSVSDNGRLLIPLRSYSTYLRFQRNRYIESLSRMGLKPPAIKQIMSEQLGEKISIRHISRLSKPE
ncbi:MAG: hypothetical protein PHF58_13475 [Methylotenera sp.]|nr:hypothetical protein [Methylotenera sp.]